MSYDAIVYLTISGLATRFMATTFDLETFSAWDLRHMYLA